MLDLAETAVFTVLVTGDRNLQFQQNLAKRQLGVVVLCGASNALEDLVPLVPAAIAAACKPRGGRMPVFAVRGVDGRVGTSPPGTEWRQWNVLTSSPTSRIPIRELLDVMLLLDVDDDREMALRRLVEKMEGSIRRYGNR